MAAILFWVAGAVVAYVYVGFPLLVRALAGLRHLPDPRTTTAKTPPSFAIIIAVYNEAGTIAARIQNLLELDYPRNKREIIVACDGCSDNTAAAAVQYEQEGVRVFDFKQNRGKAAVHNEVVPQLGAAILLFTDAETVFAPDFLTILAQYFDDPRNGCGSGDLTLNASDEIGRAESRYWEYEKAIRNDEYRLGVLPFASGACLAIRRELFHPIPLYSAEDNFLCYTTPADGYRVFYAREARCWDWAVADAASHYRKRYRTALKSFQGAMGCVPGMVRGRSWGPLWALVSHRLLRWQVGFFMALALLSNLILWHHGWVYRLALAGQLAFYGAATIGWAMSRKSRRVKLDWVFSTAYSFVSANFAFSVAMLHTLAGKRLHQYRPARQTAPTSSA